MRRSYSAVRRFGSLVRAELAYVLRTRLDVSKPNTVQSQVLPLATSGCDVLCVAQTGSGKTLAFLLPLLERLCAPSTANSTSRRDALIIVPTRELAAQHEEIAKTIIGGLQHPPRVVSCCSNALLEPNVNSETHRALEQDVGTLIISKADHALRYFRSGSLDPARLFAVAIDEADAVLCGGPYDEALSRRGEALLNAVEATGIPPQYLLATAILSTAHETALSARFSSATRVPMQSSRGAKMGTLVPSLRQRFYYTSGNKERHLIRVLLNAQRDPWLAGGTTLVFCRRSDHTERLLALISSSLIESRPRALHEHMADDERLASISALRDNTTRLLVCTDVAARGLDLPSIRHVILYDMPVDVAGFVHSAGRTARQGREGMVSCLVESHVEAKRFHELHSLQKAPPVW